MEGKRFKIFDSLVKRMRKNKKLEIGVYAAIAIAVALIYITSAAPKTSKTDDKTKTAPTNTEYAVSERELERRLESILSSISGAGNVRVMITYDTTSQMVPALSTDTQKTVPRATTDLIHIRRRSRHLRQRYRGAAATLP